MTNETTENTGASRSRICALPPVLPREIAYEQVVLDLREVVTRATRHFVDVASDDPAIAPLRALDVPSRATPATMRVRRDVDLSTCDQLRGLVTEGDCLLPWLWEGDVQFFQLGAHAFDGDVLLLSAAAESKLLTKVLHRHGERLLLLSNEPPVEYTEQLQQLLVPCGVMVAALHYAEQQPRSPELEAEFSRGAEILAAAGYGWTPDYIESLGLIGG